MKTKIFSSLIAVLLLNFCLSKTFAQGDKLYDHVSLDNPPTYPGGIAQFYNFLGANIKYPKAAMDDNVQGIVYVSFIVEKDGLLTNIKTEAAKLGSGTDEEAVRILKLSKRWNPGTQDGKAVRVKYNIPVKFAIPNKTPKARLAKARSAPATPNKDGVYDHVSLENPPTYPGGIAKFYEFLGANVKYPKAAVNSEVQGTAYVSFTIEKDGSLTDVKTNGRKLGAGLDEEAVRVLKLSKKWNPGVQNGEVVRVTYNIPIKFKLPKKVN